MLNHLMPSGNFKARKFGMGFVLFFFWGGGEGVIFWPRVSFGY